VNLLSRRGFLGVLGATALVPGCGTLGIDASHGRTGESLAGVVHCHNLEHEDMAMRATIRTV
jgi:FtsP/CotA-like multicopper oxidase with cupredoxin domain